MKHSVSIKARLGLVMLIMTILWVLGVLSASAQDPSPTPQIELRLVLPQPTYGDSADAIYAQVAQFEAETGIKVSVYINYDSATYEEYVGHAFRFDPFDVFHVSNELLDKWVTAEYMLPLDGLIEDEADFYPSVLDSVRVNGILHCIPIETWAMVLFYNRDSFDRAGLEYPTENWTWEDLRENSQLLLEANSEPLILDVVMENWLPFLYQAGGRLTDSQTGAWAFNSPEGLESLTFYSDLFQAGRINVEKRAWGGTEFAEERAGMTVQGSWMMPVSMVFDLTVNWGAVELPSHHAEGTVIATNCYAVSANTPNPEASVLLANFLTNAESQADLFFRGDLPTRISVSEAYADYWVNRASEKGLIWHQDDIQPFFGSLQHGLRIQRFESRNHTYPLEQAFRDAFEQVVNGEINVQDMLNLMEAVSLTDEP